MAILSMVTHPANMVMTIVPRAMAAFSGFERIQAFLLRESLHDQRGTLPKDSTAIQIRQLRIGYKPLILEHIDIEVATGSLAIISGPTGSGKSTLLRAMLGEAAPVQGSISLSTRQIAYCAQKPWLPSGTIKEVIHGATEIYSSSDPDNGRWYHEVTAMCCLTHDFNSLPQGDLTRIGSGGLNLSGGQRQRVVSQRIARMALANNRRHLRVLCLQDATYFCWMTPLVNWMEKQRKLSSIIYLGPQV
jgi:ABC-type bacteriocin/lantibiotic exporter with double-glycine peptidase domain